MRWVVRQPTEKLASETLIVSANSSTRGSSRSEQLDDVSAARRIKHSRRLVRQQDWRVSAPVKGQSQPSRPLRSTVFSLCTRARLCPKLSYSGNRPSTLEAARFYMPSFQFRSILRLAVVVSVFLVASYSTCRAQEIEKPDAPEPQILGARAQSGSSLASTGAQASYNHRAPYQPLSGRERVRWVLNGTFGPKSLLVGTLSEGIDTARNSPEEYGPHWDGFGKRYGIRLAGVATSNTMEASLGAIWGEDPRYARSENPEFKKRIGHIFVMAFATRNREGELKPAYARYVAIPGSNFLSNTWRAESESHAGDALTRSAYSLLGKVAGNAWHEFWPDLKRKVFKK
jgi:hypothetical protein